MVYVYVTNHRTPTVVIKNAIVFRFLFAAVRLVLFVVYVVAAACRRVRGTSIDEFYCIQRLYFYVLYVKNAAVPVVGFKNVTESTVPRHCILSIRPERASI